MDQDQSLLIDLLARHGAGDRGATDQLFAKVYAELSALARRHRRRWQGDETLNTTALVHELYLKLVEGDRPVALESRAHFLAIASKAMRQILCNYARARRQQKRGGDATRLSLDELRDSVDLVDVPPGRSEELAALDDALRRLEEIDARQGTIVECRFFGGLTIEETAAATGTSPATVKREWAVARAWLYRELQRDVFAGEGGTGRA